MCVCVERERKEGEGEGMGERERDRNREKSKLCNSSFALTSNVCTFCVRVVLVSFLCSSDQDSFLYLVQRNITHPLYTIAYK